MNNFKELERLQEEQYQNNLLNLKTKLDSNMGVLGMFSEVIELYFSKIINLFVNWSGGNSDRLDSE